MDYDQEAIIQQKNEITEYYIYSKLAELSKINSKNSSNKNNYKILNKIAKDELDHYRIWMGITKRDVKPNKFKIFYYLLFAKIFGLFFSLKLLEKGEKNAQDFYNEISKKYPLVKKIEDDELKHELELVRMLNDGRINYAGAIVLGLNDALVELTGTLAGLTFAFSNSSIIAITGLIMGIAASFSMAASGYLSSKEKENEFNPLIAALYTGIAYIITVIILVSPYFIFSNVYFALFFMLISTILIIGLYTYYISIAKELSFKKRFFEMVIISLGVALISFIIGHYINSIIGVDL